MRCLTFLFFTFLLISCESEGFEKDKRQMVARQKIRRKLHNIRAFDIISFKEDTLSSWSDTIFKQPIRYSLNFIYKDSTGALQKKTGFVLFTPDGKSVISTQITEPDQ